MIETLQVPPNAVELEKAIIGAAMLEKSALFKACQKVKSEMFYSPKHQIIWDVVMAIACRDEAVDMLTVCDELIRIKKLDKVGGVPYISELAARVGSSANIEHHCEVVVQKYINRRLMGIASHAFNNAQEDSDCGQTIATLMLELNKLTTRDGDGQIKTIDELQHAYIEQVENKRKRILAGETNVNGLDWIWDNLQQCLPEGIENGTLTTIAAAPGTGKTTLAMELLRVHGGVYVSLEMRQTQVMNRAAARATGVDSRYYRTGKADDKEMDMLRKAKLTENPVYIFEAFGLTVDKIRLKLLQFPMAKLIVIDSGQRIAKRQNMRDDLAIAEIVLTCQRVAVELNLPVILLASFNRADARDARAPKFSDINGSQAFESDSDNVYFLYKPWEDGETDPDFLLGTKDTYRNGEFYYGEDKYQIVNFICAKNRMGETFGHADRQELILRGSTFQFLLRNEIKSLPF